MVIQRLIVALGLGLFLAFTGYIVYATTGLGTSDEAGTLNTAKGSETVSRPVRCRPFYNDGTDRWIECMGVGYK